MTLNELHKQVIKLLEDSKPDSEVLFSYKTAGDYPDDPWTLYEKVSEVVKLKWGAIVIK